MSLAELSTVGAASEALAAQSYLEAFHAIKPAAVRPAPAPPYSMPGRRRNAVNQGDTYGPNSGVWYDYNYFAAHQADPANYPWNDDWRSGLAPPDHFDRIGWMDWRLKPGKSASAATCGWSLWVFASGRVST